MQNKTKNRIIALLLLSVILTVFGSVAIVSAQSTYTPLAPLDPNLTGTPAPTNLGTYANSLVKILIGIAAVLAIIMIMIGGLQYMSTDAISGKTEGKERITQALFGLGLAIASWLILTTISPTLLKVDLNVTSFPSPSIRCSPIPATCEEQLREYNLYRANRQCTSNTNHTCNLLWSSPTTSRGWCFVIDHQPCRI